MVSIVCQSSEFEGKDRDSEIFDKCWSLTYYDSIIDEINHSIKERDIILKSSRGEMK